MGNLIWFSYVLDWGNICWMDRRYSRLGRRILDCDWRHDKWRSDRRDRDRDPCIFDSHMPDSWDIRNWRRTRVDTREDFHGNRAGMNTHPDRWCYGIDCMGRRVMDCRDLEVFDRLQFAEDSWILIHSFFFFFFFNTDAPVDKRWWRRLFMFVLLSSILLFLIRCED